MDVFDNLLENLAGKVPRSLSYMTMEEAHRQLVLLAGKDYGCDPAEWQSKKVEIMARLPHLSDKERKRKDADLRKRWRQQRHADDEKT